MPSITATDPRDRLVREKYFSLRPKPLERWLWQQGLPQAAERVFWLHWEEGMRSRDWCSEIPLKRVASLCCVDPSTVTRAYQVLRNMGLIRRDCAGRDPHNPFQQATAITEVRIPRDLLTELSRAPNRGSATRPEAAEHDGAGRRPIEIVPATGVSAAAVAVIARPTRQQTRALWAKASAAECSRFFNASRDGLTQLEFDTDTQLSPEDRNQLLAQLAQLAAARSCPTAANRPGSPAAAATKPTTRTAFAPSRRLSLLELARTRKRIQDAVPGPHATDILRQVIWAVEEGALRRFETALGVNIALKKIREGSWTKPNRMPPNWLRADARTETCSAA